MTASILIAGLQYDLACADGHALATTYAEHRTKPSAVAVQRHVGHCNSCTRLTKFEGIVDVTRGPSHGKPDFSATDVAARIRAGESLEFICAELDRAPSTVLGRLSTAGYGPDGVAHRPPKSDPKGTPGPTLPAWWQPWRDDALCAQTDPEEFFPEIGRAHV